VTAVKRVRWNCPNDKHPAILASTRPPIDSIERYCMPCTQETGRLAKRIAPALERKRAAAAVTSAAKTKAKRAREAKARERKKAAETKRYTVEGHDLREDFQSMIRLKAFGGRKGRLFRRPPKFVISYRSSHPLSRLGFATPWENKITVANWPRATYLSVRLTLLHELTHVVVGRVSGTGEGWHGRTFKKTLTAAYIEAFGEKPHWWYIDATPDEEPAA
jgi:hypothetical protein